MARDDYNLTLRDKQARDTFFDTGRIYLAKVKDVRNVTRGGELKVWLYNSGLDENDEDKWITAYYCSNFFGTSPYEANNTVKDKSNNKSNTTSDIIDSEKVISTPKTKDNNQSNSDNNYESVPKSFGSWFPMPCVGNDVFIFYPCITGETLRPYWFGSPVNADRNSMLPGIPRGFEKNKDKPLCELNDKNDADYNKREVPQSKKEEAKTTYTPLHKALKKQGLLEDKLRGLSTAGSKRESPSMCYGFLTPFGNSLTMDDGWDNFDNRKNWKESKEDTSKKQFKGEEKKRLDAGFRFRTRNGTQVLISDMGIVYLINADGSAWAEITDDGCIQGYAKKYINFACDGDINLRSKKNIILDADGDINVRAKGRMTFETTCIDMKVKEDEKIITNGIIQAPTIETKKGSIETFESSNATLKGQFYGTGNISWANQCGYSNTCGNLLSGDYFGQGGTATPETPSQIEAPTYKELDIPVEKEIEGQGDKKQKTIVSKAPTAEPYKGHCRNSKYNGSEDNKDDGSNQNNSNKDKDLDTTSKTQDSEKSISEANKNNGDISKENIKETVNKCCGGNVSNNDLNKIVENKTGQEALNCIKNGSCDNILSPYCGNNLEQVKSNICSNYCLTNNQYDLNNSYNNLNSCNNSSSCFASSQVVNNNVTRNTIIDRNLNQTYNFITVPNRYISSEYTLYDACYSQIANLHNIINNPTGTIITNLEYIAQNVLDPLTTQYGRVIIDSGYRCHELNYLVNGATNSQHLLGQAMDIHIKNVPNMVLAQWIRDNLEYDQLILEQGNNLSYNPYDGWVHVSFNILNNRKQVLTMNKYGTKQGLYII